MRLELDDVVRARPGDPCVESEGAFNRMVVGYQHAVVGFAQAGNNVIADHYLAETSDELLPNGSVLMVGVRCPLDELERRERDRPSELQGFARSQFERIHEGNEYTVEVNTARSTPEECAKKVSKCYRERRERIRG